MQIVKIVSDKSIDELRKCSLCSVKLTRKTVYLDEDYSYCKKCFMEVLSTSIAEEIKVERYGSI